MPENEQWYTLSAVVARGSEEAAESAFGLVGALGTQIDGLRKPVNEPLEVVAYFDRPVDAREATEAIRAELELYGHDPDRLISVSAGVAEAEDWLAEWKRHWQPTASGRFIVTPPWIDVDPGSGIVIKIEPNMAFGTGTHDTTRLCLELLGDRHEPGRSFLDVGTGTGLLAIAAAKAAQEEQRATGPIFGCDTDIPSIEIARQNAIANGVGDMIEFVAGSIDAAAAEYDTVFANVTLDVILPMLDDLVDRAGRLLVLSGILAIQRTEIIEALSAYSFAEIEVRESGEWIAVAAVR